MRQSRPKFILLLALLLGPQRAHAAPREYQLGPQDQLQVKVYDLRTGTGEAYQWTAFNGDFIVSASGRVSLPLVGELDANGKTTADLAAVIAASLQTKVGLAARPDASVQVTKYRPVYVMGSVDKPGEYDYRPDLTVLQAAGLAGGLARLGGDVLLGYARDALNTRGDLRSLTVARYALLARQARLDAEISDATMISVPGELKMKASDPDVARTLREEQMLFDARRHAIESQAAALEEAKNLAQKQIASLGAKDQKLEQQLDTTKRELSQIQGLVSKGLTVLPRQLEMEQTTAQFETNRLDVAVATLRAQQDASTAERSILELKNTRRSDALQEATDVHNKLADTNERIETAERLIAQVEVHAPALLADETAAQKDPDFLITRRIGDMVKTQRAKEDDLVQPGDVVRVIPRHADDRSPANRAESTGPTTPGLAAND